MSRYQNIKGVKGEQAAMEFLMKKGFTILEENYRVQGGEIDLIAVENDKIHFIEVKTRKPDDLYSGLEAVDRRKQKLLIRTAFKFCSEHIIDLQPCFDVALVCMSGSYVHSISYFENAFDI